MSCTLVVIFNLFLTLASGLDGVVYPERYEQQQLAAIIHCEMEETQHFRYSSSTKLWGEMGGEIVVNADVSLHCLGDDSGGKYGSQALRYLVEVSNLLIEETKEKEFELIQLRPKRGVGEFFTEAWDKVKTFFKRVFGRRGSGPESVLPIPADVPVDDKKEEEEESTEEFIAEDLQTLYSTPFQFVQLANGTIPEIRFAENEEDGRVKNFKRHLVDAFATKLNFEQEEQAVLETSVMGEHTANYSITRTTSDSTPLNTAGFGSHLVQRASEGQTVMVSKRITESDIVRLAPSEALNNPENMALQVQQTQIFRGGKLVSSTGTSSVALLPNSGKQKSRAKREVEEDVTSYFHAHSTFDVQLKKRQRRSLKTDARLKRQDSLSFSPSSRFAEVEDNRDKDATKILLRSSEDMNHIFKNLLTDDGKDYDEKMQLMFEIVERELSLKIDKEPISLSVMIRTSLNQETMQELCKKNFSLCKDFLQLLTLTGGPEAEKVLLSFLENNGLSPRDLRTVCDIMSDLSSPSPDFLGTVSEIISNPQIEDGVLGSLCLSAGFLASKANLDSRRIISDTFIKLLEERKNQCRSDPLVVDILEAIGNLAWESTVQPVFEVSELCEQDSGIQIASVHALRHFVHLPSVQPWIEKKIKNGNCDVITATIGTLLDKIQDQEIKQDAHNWPRFGFNEIDKILRKILYESRCSAENILRYFDKKKNPESKRIAQNFFEPESEPWDPGSGSRHKRSLWDDLNCQEWTEDNKYNPIQDKEEFAADRATYNKRKSCLAFRRLGVKGANAEIYAGMFAGVKEPSEPTKYKLFTKFVSSLNFLGNQMEIGSFYFYLHSGSTKAYVRILGRTRQEFTHDGCTPTELRYRPIKHVPLYLLSVSTVQLSLGIHLSSRLSMDSSCPGNDAYKLEPLTDVRIGGEAVGNVLFIKGSANLGANFNYKLQVTFLPSPNMCLSGSHGYDPMKISFESYFQLWNKVKNDWGKLRMWRPSFLSWEVTRGKMKQWFEDTCVVMENSKPPLNMERELE
ncbi:uncharacterized protein LOC129234433 [Uloborus diversus]|uniref:uncharacterized protein LOC129234433 n=1 Tax=Uloborus diversus TaxID=327109 RepID=UPI0024090421|nr:uncharacterized protein LOC129234433 [Uloborus diversus]